MDELSFVCFSVNNWEKRKARKQQFMLHLSKKENVSKVLYIEPALNFFRLLVLPFLELKTQDNRNRWQRALRFKIEFSSESQKLFIFTPIFFIPFSFRIQSIYNVNLFISLLIIKAKIKRIGFKNVVLWLYHPFDYPLLTWFKNRVVSVFDWAEEWGEYFIEFNKRKKEKIKVFEEKIIKNVDIVFVVSQRLLEIAKKSNKNSYRLLDGTVYEIFQKASEYVPEDIKYVKKPILGYLGTINERVDIELLEFISKELPQTSLVLVGNIHSQRIDISGLNSYKSIYFLGGKDYGELGSYTQCFDVCILPYKPEITLSFPTKALDYFATGKPVVSTNLIEIKNFNEILYIARTKEEFIEYIKKALKENSPYLSQKRIEIARENTWEKRASQIIKIIKGV